MHTPYAAIISHSMAQQMTAMAQQQSAQQQAQTEAPQEADLPDQAR